MFLCISRFQQVEDIAASLMPGKNLLTKTIKKMFENLLRWDEEFSDTGAALVLYNIDVK